MSIINIDVSFPLDEDGYFRRECPLCIKQFKVKIEEDEINKMGKNQIEDYLLEDSQEEVINQKDLVEYTCPYCGQTSSSNSWWTEEQINYINSYVENIMAELINKNLIGKLKKMARRSSCLEFNGKKMKFKEPWIAPETSKEFKIINLECCNEKIKVDKNEDEIYCYYCGFKHELED